MRIKIIRKYKICCFKFLNNSLKPPLQTPLYLHFYFIAFTTIVIKYYSCAFKNIAHTRLQVEGNKNHISTGLCPVMYIEICPWYVLKLNEEQIYTEKSTCIV